MVKIENNANIIVHIFVLRFDLASLALLIPDIPVRCQKHLQVSDRIPKTFPWFEFPFVILFKKWQ